MSKGSEYLSQCDISVFPVFVKFAKISKILFSISHYGILNEFCNEGQKGI